MPFKKQSTLILISLALLFFIQCREEPMPSPNNQVDIDINDLSVMAQSNQRSGNAEVGKDYLLNGDYVDSGIPLDIFKLAIGTDPNDIGREGINEGIRFDFNAFTSVDGIEMVAPNCFQCHASMLNGELVLGLGNIEADFTVDQAGLSPLLDQLVMSTYGDNSPEWLAYEPFSNATKVTASSLITETVGANPADKLAFVLAAHRDKNTLEWIDEEQFDVPAGVIPTDVPPWWNLKKKHTMFHNGVGKGDFARISMASSLLTLKDSTRARVVDNNFADVIAYINTLEPPAFPEIINPILALEGEDIFFNNCSQCHGTYGFNENYPNLLVGINTIQTDSLLISANFGAAAFTGWYNDSWFGQAPNAAKLIPEKGYIAPPLDGIWASAPYLHNGSVPDLASLLESSTRPDIWKRVGSTDNYNYETMGWNYESLDSKIDKFTYDTSIPGYGNQGHVFGDHLTDADRRAVLEYLKTL